MYRSRYAENTAEEVMKAFNERRITKKLANAWDKPAVAAGETA